jgi:hypothetical protein
MEKLAAELGRLYPTAPDGTSRVISLGFNKLAGDAEDGHWRRLCVVANALQAELGLPAPAVSVSGAGAYGLWLSLETPVPMVQAQEFMELLCAAYCPEMKLAADAASGPTALPPCQHSASGKWAGFIHPGMGDSFAGDEGLDMRPPDAGQVGLLEGLKSTGAAQFAQALNKLRQSVPDAAQRVLAALPSSAVSEGLLLKDATLEDIVSFLHSKNIEPTFRFLV